MKNLIIILISILSACNQQAKEKERNYTDGFDTSFNSTIWNRSNTYGRGKMAKDLISSGILTNMHKDSVLILLGKPSEVGEYFYNYLIGSRDTSISVNYLLIHIELDSVKQTVIDYWLTD